MTLEAGLVAASQRSSVHIVDSISHDITRMITCENVEKIEDMNEDMR